MTHSALTDYVHATAEHFAIPGAAVGVWANGAAVYACHGVTSIENPLPVDQDTLFQLGSVSKTFTATAMMRLVGEGKVELGAPVRRYVPELRLKDERAAATITVLNLLNHTSGLSWGLTFDSGEGEGALEAYVGRLSELELLAPPGARTSYSQAGFNLAGYLLQHVTGLSFERAIATLVLEPLGLSHSFYMHEEVMTRRFAVAHTPDGSGHLTVARMLRRPRGDNPGGGLAASAVDMLRWARFHLGDGRAESGEPVVPADILHQMRQPTAPLRGSNMGQAIGIGWFLREVDGVATIGHNGSTNGQFADLLLVPDRNFAVIALSNASPGGIPCNQAIVRWALRTFADLEDRDPEPLPYDDLRAREILGAYEDDASQLSITRTSAPGLQLEVRMKPEVRANYRDMPPDYPPFDLGLLPGDTDEYILTSGAFTGQRGFFTRDQGGAVVGVDLAGRLYKRARC